MWVHQVHNFGLGNFINCTPAIKKLSKRHNRAIDVYFDLPFVADCFRDCPFINILDTKPNTKPLFTSVLTGTNWNTRPDYQFIFENVIGEKWDGQRCYVDEPKGYDIPKVPYVVIVHGSGNESRQYLDTKEIDSATLLSAVNACKAKNFEVVFTGSINDMSRNTWMQPYAKGINDVRHALALISGANVVIGNDTGLIHASGAMNKKTFVFWKHTQLPRCMNSGEDCTYLMRSEWDKIGGLVKDL